MNLDVLVIGPHPDDAELGAGGTLALLARRGARVGILDLTRGELGTRGTADERSVEAGESARILGLAVRENAGLPDGQLANTPEQRAILITLLRRLRPRVLIVPQAPDRHPDHAAAHALCTDANFLAEVGDPATGEPVGATADNLRSAVAGETYEYTQMYPGFAKTARDEGFDEIAEWLETLARAEKSHAGRFGQGLENLS